MKRFNCDFSSRFRILKGGKISLVVSSMLITSSLMGIDYTTQEIDTTISAGNLTFEDTAKITSIGSITNTDDSYYSAFEAETIDYFSTFENAGTIDVNVNADNLASGMKFITILADINEAGLSTVRNSGTIEIINNAMGAISGDVTVLRAAGISGGDSTDSIITNSGSITVATGNMSGIGIQRTGDAVGINIGNLNNADIINEVSTGSITVTSGNATSTDAGAYSGKAIGIKALALSNGSLIQNSGTMTVNGGNSVGVADSQTDSAFGIFTAGVTGSSIINSGTLTVNGGDASCDNDTIQQGDVIGIYVDGGLVSSTITNSGTLTVNGGNYIYDGDITNGSASKGIFVHTGADADSVIRNTASIAVNSAGNTYGIEIWNGLSGSVFNDTGATISAISTERDATGIAGSSLFGNATISNSGTITATSTDDYAYGIKTGSLNNNSSISNSHNINATSTSSYAFGIKTDSLRANASISNSGTITATSTNSEAKGIYIDGDLYGSVENDGTISVTAGSIATGILSGGQMYDDNALISNTLNGTITVTSTGDNAFGISATSNEDYEGRIINAGVITVTTTSSGSHTAYGIKARADGHYMDLITNTGTITAKSDFVSYGIFEELDNTNPTINSGTISGLDTDGELFAKGFSFKGSDLDNTSTGEMYGNIIASGTINNAGLISLPHQAGEDDFSPAASIHTFNNTGTLEIGLLTDGTLNGSTYSKLETTNATFENGSTIKVNVLAASTNVALLEGSRLENVVTSSTALTITDTLNITDNSALLDFNYVTSDGWINGEDGSIHLNIVKATDENGEEITIETATREGGGNKNTQASAKVLNNISDNLENFPEMNSVITAFNSLETEEEIAQAVQTTTTLTPTATFGATTQISNGIAGIVTQRQNANIVGGGGLNSGDTMFADKNFWFKPFGSIGSQNDKDGISGFDLKTQGFGLGLDGEYKNNQNIGFGLFYTNANVDINNISQEADLNVFTALVYGNVPVIDDKTNFLYQAGYSWQKTEGSREIFTGDVATSDYTSKTASLDLKLMRDVQVSDNLLLQPLVNTTYRHFTNPAYKENGAGALNLNIDEFTSTDLIVGAGTLVQGTSKNRVKLQIIL